MCKFFRAIDPGEFAHLHICIFEPNMIAFVLILVFAEIADPAV
jgi:hypothetical protein